MSELSSDWWLAEGHRPNAPKREIGDYVESQGFRVPRRFDSLDEAFGVVKQGEGIILRSEHPDEYDGPSGLMNSYFFNQDIHEYKRAGRSSIDLSNAVNWSLGLSLEQAPGMGDSIPMARLVLSLAMEAGESDEVVLGRLSQLTQRNSRVRRYAELTNQGLDTFVAETGFSIWEHIPGMNVTIVADDAIDGRYHTFNVLTLQEDGDRIEDWRIVNEAGESERESGEMPLLSPSDSQAFVEAYEAIRNLPRFNSEHCPIIELQMDRERNIWFLQYHRSRDYKPASHIINPRDFPASEGWQRVDGVRGSIDSPTSILLHTTDSYRLSRLALPEIKHGTIGPFSRDKILGEIAARRLAAFLTTSPLSNRYNEMAAHHTARSEWFKPQVALSGVALLDTIPFAYFRMLATMADDEPCYLRAEVASDGRTGYMRLNPDEEQPGFDDEI